MNKYQILKDSLKELFSKATDKETIEKSAVIAKQLDDLEADNTALAKSKGELLDDYKKLVLTASYKPAATENVSGSDTPQNKSFEDALSDFKKSRSK